MKNMALKASLELSIFLMPINVMLFILKVYIMVILLYKLTPIL